MTPDERFAKSVAETKIAADLLRRRLAKKRMPRPIRVRSYVHAGTRRWVMSCRHGTHETWRWDDIIYQVRKHLLWSCDGEVYIGAEPSKSDPS